MILTVQLEPSLLQRTLWSPNYILHPQKAARTRFLEVGDVEERWKFYRWIFFFKAGFLLFVEVV